MNFVYVITEYDRFRGGAGHFGAVLGNFFSLFCPEKAKQYYKILQVIKRYTKIQPVEIWLRAVGKYLLTLYTRGKINIYTYIHVYKYIYKK